MMFVKIVGNYALDVNLNEVIKMKYSNTFSMVKSAVAKAIQNQNVKMIICCKNYHELNKISKMISTISRDFNQKAINSNAIIISVFSAYFANNSEIRFVNLSTPESVRGYVEVDDLYLLYDKSYNRYITQYIRSLNTHTYEE